MSDPNPAALPREEAFEPNRAIISLPAIAHNAAQVSTLLSDHTALMAIVKADAYGHGMVDAAKAAIQGGATWLGVAHPASALTLIRAGFDVPLLAWLHEPRSAAAFLPHAIEAGIDLAVSSIGQAKLVADAARTVDRRARIHVKLDTGMGRAGVRPEHVGELGRLIRADDHLHVVGAMSHLHDADTLNDPSIDAQAEQFESMCRLLEEETGPIGIKHLANSAATLTRPDLHYDMVRPGIVLYGYAPVETDLDLRPAMSLTSSLSLTKPVPAGQTVGYGATYTTDAPTTLGLAPIGYADGIHRSASNKVTVAVRTAAGIEVAPQVGRISMDQIVLNLGPDTAAQPGDEVILWGDPSADENIPSAEDWARAENTIVYEVLTSVNERVARSIEPLDGTHEPVWKPAEAASAPALTVRTAGAEDTRRAAQALANSAKAGDLYVLDGPLGAGKTTFTQGFSRALNVSGNVASPTFVIARVHPAEGSGPNLVHVDAYRLDDDWDIEDLDLDSDLDQAIMLVEWGRDRVEHLSDSYAMIELRREETLDADGTDNDPDNTDENRSLTATFVGPRYTDRDIRRVHEDLRDAGFDCHLDKDGRA